MREMSALNDLDPYEQMRQRWDKDCADVLEDEWMDRANDALDLYWLALPNDVKKPDDGEGLWAD